MSSLPNSISHIVAIGASAGGLDALERLFDNLSCESGASFVVIQHLSPDHKSMMANLLARHTAMPVAMVEQDMLIAPNHVYLIPPGAIMHVSQGHLRLTPKNPRTLTLPIDVFFSSLATHHGAGAVGVILSGTGSDGTRGASAINAGGGVLIAQQPDEAKFDGMPRSVIATGLVDAILPVAQIGPRLLAHVHNQPFKMPEPADEPVAGALTGSTESAMAGVLLLLKQLGGIDFNEYKPGTVMRRIERRMTVCQVSSLEIYLERLKQDRNEVLILRRELLIPVTSFFRDAEAFETLNRDVIEPLVSRKQTGDAIRVWAAAVSTGEEAYSLAMLFMEAFDRLKRWPNLKIFATDVEQHNIEIASSGSYPESIAAEVSQMQLERFFTRKGNNFVVRSELRQCIVFARHNMLSDPPFTKMDLVVCRNALIYFRNLAQERALKRFQYALVPNGYLFQGSSESLGEAHQDFQAISARHKIWQVTRPVVLPMDMGRDARMHHGGVVMRPAMPAGVGGRRATGIGSVVERGFATLVKAFSPPPSVLVNSRHELVHSYGDVRYILRLREGQASLSLNRVLPEELISVAAALLYKADRERNSISANPLRIVDANGVARRLRLSAWPVGEVDGERLTLLAFETADGPPRKDALETVDVDVDAETRERIELLERELSATRESLQATIEELETSNEELQATNEEMMASNEELQSSNEELQSLNEELNTVNAEYQEKIEIMNRLAADLDSMTRSVAAGTVFVDHKMHLTRFSPDATQIFKLRESDIGRRLDDLVHNLIYPDLVHDLGRTMETNSKIEKEVLSLSGRHYLVRMVPYKLPSSAARGAVASFVDVTAIHDVLRLQQIINCLAAHIAVLNTDGVITMVNHAWTRFAQANGDEALVHTSIGVNYLDVCSRGSARGGKEVDAVAQGIRDVLEGRQQQYSLEYPCHAPGEERWFVMHVSALDGERPGAVVSHVNITQWRQRQSRENV